MYQPNNKQTYWYVDSLNMISTQPIPNEWDDGHYDGIEKALHAFIAYGDERFIKGIDSCWRWEGNKFVGKRYPNFNWNEAGISRDHTIYSFVAWKLSGQSNNFLLYKAESLPLQLGASLGMLQTPSLWLWLRLISGKKIGLLWYLWKLLSSTLALVENKLVSLLFNFPLKETPQESFVKGKQSKVDKLLFPTYALKLAAFQFYVLPDSFIKRVIQKIYLWNVPSENTLLKVMFGGKVSQEQVDNYKPMYGDRWSDELNPQRTRGDILEVITNEEHLEANTLDKDLLQEIYNKKIK
jgi:hypothetical protein